MKLDIKVSGYYFDDKKTYNQQDTYISSDLTVINNFMKEVLGEDYDNVVAKLQGTKVNVTKDEFILNGGYSTQDDKKFVNYVVTIYSRRREDIDALIPKKEEPVLDINTSIVNTSTSADISNTVHHELKQEERPKRKPTIKEYYKEGETFMVDDNMAMYVRLNTADMFSAIYGSILPTEEYSLIFSSALPKKMYPKSDINFFDLTDWNTSDYFPYGLYYALFPANEPV